MTVLEIMERAGADNSTLTIAWIKDAVNLVQSNTPHDVKVKKISVTKADDGDDNRYELPADLMSLLNVSVLDTEDGNKYKRIRRLTFQPLISEDKEPNA